MKTIFSEWSRPLARLAPTNTYMRQVPKIIIICNKKVVVKLLLILNVFKRALYQPVLYFEGYTTYKINYKLLPHHVLPFSFWVVLGVSSFHLQRYTKISFITNHFQLTFISIFFPTFSPGHFLEKYTRTALWLRAPALKTNSFLSKYLISQ